MRAPVPGKRHLNVKRAAEFVAARELVTRAGNGEVGDALLVASGWYFTVDGLTAFKKRLDSESPREAA